MKPPKISVIIPVYQAESFLSDCIDSVLSQNYPLFEIILTDDGSTDRSPEICDSYAKAYPNIRVIHQQNKGPAAARNVGMKIASGEYLMFLDADDFLAAPDIFSHMAKRISRTKADILAGNFSFFQNGQPKKIQHHHLKSGAYVQTSLFRFHAFYHSGHLSYIWGKLYRKQFLEKNQILFQSHPIGEDKLFNLECYLKGALYDFTNRPILFYRQRSKSETSRYHPDFSSFWIDLGKAYTRLRIQCHAPREYEDITAFHYFFGFLLLVREELKKPKKTGFVSHSLKITKTYVTSPVVFRSLRELSRGTYLRQFPSLPWRLFLQGTAFLLTWSTSLNVRKSFYDKRERP